MSYKKIICIDFDGVIHQYISGWQGIDAIPDYPVPGAFQFLRDLVHSTDMQPVIYSCRSQSYIGIDAMKRWFIACGLEQEILSKLVFAKEKPAAFLTIDDRAFCFKGQFPSKDEINAFKPWYIK